MSGGQFIMLMVVCIIILVWTFAKFGDDDDA